MGDAIEPKWTQSPAHRELLVRFLCPQALEDLDPQHWHDCLHEPPQDVLVELATLGLIREATPAEKLGHWSGAELQALLKARQLKTSGAKAVLIQRLVDHDAASMAALTRTQAIFVCSASGAALIEPYCAQRNAHQAADRDERERQRAAQYQALLDGRLHSTFTAVPQLLRKATAAELRILRIAAQMMQDFGDSGAWRWFPADFAPKLPMDPEAAARMLIFYARHLDDRRTYVEMHCTHVRLSGSKAPDACAACRALDGRIFALSEAPELPFARCRSDMGCRCLYLPILHS